MNDQDRDTGFSRRSFMKSTAAGAVSLAAVSAFHPGAYAAGSDKIRLGVVGCGGRGTHDVTKCLKSDENVELVAMGDLFQDKLDNCRNVLSKSMPGKVKVTDEMCFVGWDAYKKVVASDVDLVIFTTPPGFRPMHLKAAIEGGQARVC